MCILMVRKFVITYAMAELLVLCNNCTNIHRVLIFYYPQVASSLSCKVPLWVHVSFSVPSIRSTVFGVFSILSGNNTLLLFCELINH